MRKRKAISFRFFDEWLVRVILLGVPEEPPPPTPFYERGIARGVKQGVSRGV